MAMFDWLSPFFGKQMRKTRTRRNARPRLEILEPRNAPSVSTTFVNDNWQFISDSDNSGTLSFGDEVRNTNDTRNPGSVTAFYGLNAFGTVLGAPDGVTSLPGDVTINDAIAKTNVGGTVNVLQGTYAENVVIPNALTLVGAQANVTPVAGGRTGGESIINGPGAQGISILSDNVTVNGFEVSQEPFSITTNDQGGGGSGGAHSNVQILFNDIQSTVANNAGIVLAFNVNGPSSSTFNNYAVSNNLINVSGPTATAAIGIGASDAAYNNLTISDNDISNANGTGIFAGGDPATVTMSGAVISGNTIHDTGDAGINIGSGGDMSIRDNTFTDIDFTAMQVGLIGGEIVGNTFSQIHADVGAGFGDVIELWGGQFNTEVSTNVNITNNVVNFNDVVGATDPVRAIRLRLPASGSGIDGTTIHINDNAFLNGGVITDGSAFAIVDQGDPTKPVDASGNWWSTTNATAIAALMSGPVDFTPYLGSATDTDAVTAGFQGDFSTLFVTALGAQTGATGRIQEAIGLATGTAPIVNIDPGTYNETVTANKANLTLQGTSGIASDFVIQPTGGADGVDVTANNVVLRDLSINGAGSAIVANGVNMLTLADLLLSGNTSGGTISNVNTLSFSASSGNDTVTLGANSLSSSGVQAMTLTGVTNLNVDAGAGNDIFLVTNTPATNVVLNGDAGDDRYYVAATGSGSVLTLNGGADNDQFNVSGTEKLDNILGHVSVDGGTGTDSLLVSDQAQTTGHTYIVRMAQVTRTDLPGFLLTFQNVDSLNLRAGSGNDVIYLTGQTPGTSISLSGLGGNDTFNVQVFSNTGYSGVVVNGGSGRNSLYVTDKSGGGVITRSPTTGTTGVVRVKYPNTIGALDSAIQFQNIMNFVFSPSGTTSNP